MSPAGRDNAPETPSFRFAAASLKVRIVAVTLGILALTVWMLASQSVAALRRDMERNVSGQQLAAAGLLADHLDESLRTRVEALRTVAGGITPAMLLAPPALQRFLAERRAIYLLFMQGLYVLSPQGVCLVEQPRAGRVGRDFSGEPYFRAIQAGAELAFGKTAGRDAGSDGSAVFAVPVRDRGGRLAAVLTGSQPLQGSAAIARIAGAFPGVHGEAFLVSLRDRSVVDSSLPERVGRPLAEGGMEALLAQLAANGSGSAAAVAADGREMLLAGKRIGILDWVLVVALPSEQAFAPIAAMERRMYFAAALLTGLFGALMWFFVRRELAPLDGSVALLRQMSRGVFDLQPMPLRGAREIRELQAGFNQLQAHVIAQQKLISRESARNAVFLAAASDGVHIMDRRGDIVEASPAFCRMLGYAREEVIGMNIAAWEAQWSGEEIWRQLARPLTAPVVVLTRHRRKDGGEFDVEVHATRFELDGEALIFAAARDITERKQAEAHIHQLAFFDPLTALPNRRLLLDRLEQALAACRRNNLQGALLFLDLDHFKILNDTCGHDVGDRLLVQVGVRLRACVREVDTVARLGGDEFVVMLGDLAGDAAGAQAESVSEKIRASLERPYELGEHSHRCGVSIGISLFPDDGATAEQVLKRADLALYQAKEAGRNQIRFFSPAMQAAIGARAELESGLRRALLGEEFRLHYLPQVDARGRIVGAEALLRWQHPQRGLLPPAEFIPAAEDCGLILPIGRWLLRTACRRLAAWQGDQREQLSLAVKVGLRQFLDAEFAERVRLELAASGADPTRLRLELPQRLVFDNFEAVAERMRTLREIGVGLGLADSGTGHFSLSGLQRLPLAYLKIDCSQVRDLACEPRHAEIVRAILAICRALRLPAVAEHVDEPGQRTLLAAEGCQAFQGRLFSPAVPAGQFEALLAGGRALYQEPKG